MHRFWNKVIAPMLDAADATKVAEVGVDRGDTTRLLLERASRLGRGVVHAVDPAPKLDPRRWRARYGKHLSLHLDRSHDALERIAPVDAALLDGDHNWYTVSGELKRLARSAAEQSCPLPLVLAHDVGWPYGRRDMYYTLDSVPSDRRQEAARVGILPGVTGLSDDGLNPWLWNAVRSGGPENGVRTAIEDFAASCESGYELLVLEGFHGLGIFASRDRLASSPGLKDAFTRLRSTEFTQEWLRLLERARVEAEIQAWWAMGRPAPNWEMSELG